MFSSRLPDRLAENTITRALARVRRSGASVLDLTETNPTAVGLTCPTDVLASLSDPRAGRYRPDPRGLEEARRAVSASYHPEGAPAPDPDRIVLTSSTSEAYAFLFKLLCDPGEAVFVPQPSYPLFDLLTRLEGVRAIPYPLVSFDAWAIDRDGLLRQLTEDCRAVLVVSPNNPTGSLLRAGDREWLVSLAREHGLALISDEVFADYPLSPRPDSASLAGEDRVLTFALGGLSKSAALPQLKLAWIAASGPDALLRPAIDRLELIADSYLSVSTPVQIAASRLIDAGRAIRQSVIARLGENLACLRSLVHRGSRLTLLEPEGGWSVVLRVPAVEPEEQIVLRLVDTEHVLVHPGYFFDFPEEGYLVLSLLPDPHVFGEAVGRLVRLFEGGFDR
jgi:aspartate/methionine/tyrosine aminotransferase